MNALNEIPKSVISFNSIWWTIAIGVLLCGAGFLVKSASNYHPVREIAEWKLGEFGIPMNMTIGEAEMYSVTDEFNDKLKGYGLTTESTIEDLLRRMHL